MPPVGRGSDSFRARVRVHAIGRGASLIDWLSRWWTPAPCRRPVRSDFRSLSAPPAKAEPVRNVGPGTLPCPGQGGGGGHDQDQRGGSTVPGQPSDCGDRGLAEPERTRVQQRLPATCLLYTSDAAD